MRIIAGKWRGRTLAVPVGATTRPTADRTREALFSMLTSRLGSFDDLSVADIFAGTGALGLEAMSRGASHVTFVEQDRAALAILRANLATMGIAAEVLPVSISALGLSHRAHDLLLFDPPYRSGGAGALLERLTRLGWATPAAWASVETAKDEEVSASGWLRDAERVHGPAKLTLLRREAAAPSPEAQPG